MTFLKRVAVVLLFMSLSAVSAWGEDASISESIKGILGEGRRVAGQELRTLPLLQKFYETRESRPVWLKGDSPTSLAKNLVGAINLSTKEGLSPNLYRIEEIRKLMEDKSDPAELELLLTDAFFSMGFHYSYGAVDPDTLRIRWFEPEAAEKLRIVLDTAINTNNAEGPLKSLLPANKAYADLKKVLVKYEEMAPNVKWPKIDSLSKGQKINAGDEDRRIPAIRERLAKKAPQGQGINPDIYDDDLEQAVIQFQRENGLLDDGVIGYRTVDQMNVSIEDRICQIRVGLDRLRALSRVFDEKRRAVVNIPAFWLEVYDNGELALDMKVIAGMVKRKTPTLSSEIDHLIFSPKWYVPDTILFEDKLPHIKKDPSYLRKHGMRVYEKGGGEIDPETVDWTQFQSKHIPYRVVQGSGDLNALGHVKFKFPNRYDVYLHDTPDKRLFKNAQRSFSSGCIRIEKPVEMASLLLKDKPEWNEEKIKDAMNRSHEQFVPLSRTMPIHIIYLTAWVDKSGTTQFREDIYGRDSIYKKLLCD